jgi:hypothetical protein
LFRYGKGIVDLDAEVPDGAFDLCMSKQELHAIACFARSIAANIGSSPSRGVPAGAGLTGAALAASLRGLGFVVMIHPPPDLRTVEFGASSCRR